RLAAMVAKGQIDRVLFFQDPRDLEIEHPENYALLRNCNLHGCRFCINEAAHLWAQCQRHKEKAAPRIQRKPTDLADETVALIAFGKEKERMARFVLRYAEAFQRFPRLLATSGTKDYIDRFLDAAGRPDTRLKIESAGLVPGETRGPAGGDVIIA